jgi:hypothetical protein
MIEDVRLQWGDAFFPRELDSSFEAYRLVDPDYKDPLGSLRLKLNLIFGAISLQARHGPSVEAGPVALPVGEQLDPRRLAGDAHTRAWPGIRLRS